jgi:hypothetical protein
MDITTVIALVTGMNVHHRFVVCVCSMVIFVTKEFYVAGFAYVTLPSNHFASLLWAFLRQHPAIKEIFND